jgi:hypothetical protein
MGRRVDPERDDTYSVFYQPYQQCAQGVDVADSKSAFPNSPLARGRDQDPQSEIQDLQDTTRQLKAQVMELETRLAGLQGSAGFSVARPAALPSASQIRATAGRGQERHHRRWYECLWQAAFPIGLRARDLQVIILVVIILSMLVGLWATKQKTQQPMLLAE